MKFKSHENFYMFCASDTEKYMKEYILHLRKIHFMEFNRGICVCVSGQLVIYPGVLAGAGVSILTKGNIIN